MSPVVRYTAIYSEGASGFLDSKKTAALIPNIRNPITSKKNKAKYDFLFAGYVAGFGSKSGACMAAFFLSLIEPISSTLLEQRPDIPRVPFLDLRIKYSKT